MLSKKPNNPENPSQKKRKKRKKRGTVYSENGVFIDQKDAVRGRAHLAVR
jgi:hypothetical protein